MKVLFLVNIPSPYRVDFFNELGKLCDLTVLYERKSAADRNENWLSSKSKSFKEVFLKGKHIRKDTAFNPEITKYLRKGLFDLFIIGGYSTPTGMFAIENCKLKKIPFILNADGGIIGTEGKIKYKMKKHFIGSASAWLSTGSNTSNYLIHYGAKKEKMYVYPFTSISEKNVLNTPLSLQTKSVIKKKLGIENKPTAIAVGQFIHRKGFDTLINSWAKVNSEYNLLVIGGGEKEQELNEQIRKLNLTNVTLLDFMSSNQLTEYYKASDLFILPTREDIWGLVVNEAMANGLPVITTEKCVAGLELITDGENGYIVPIENELILSERINEILVNRELKNKMGEKSIEKIKQYTLESMAKRHIEIFEKEAT
ncbi:glycosyltransferase family 4 protein [Peribacillus butanolivorans]|uniref:glycosyltransferase family 4 protein n=1 Tax=Peribacillus butanolivorans TaxID=421767 RepID=UPI0030C9A79F